jgi:hypothetical protein
MTSINNYRGCSETSTVRSTIISGISVFTAVAMKSRCTYIVESEPYHLVEFTDLIEENDASIFGMEEKAKGITSEKQTASRTAWLAFRP